MTGAPHRLEVRDLTVERLGQPIVSEASLDLDSGEIRTIRGPSGCGKSTLLRAIATLIPISRGTIALDGRAPTEIGDLAYRRRVAYVAQSPHMFDMTVVANVQLGPKLRGEAMAESAAVKLLADVGLDAAIGARNATDLSGGERLRVALARALALDPIVLLLDEPTSALDSAASEIVIAHVRAVAERGVSIIAVTHIEEHARALGGSIQRMEAGALGPLEVAPP